MHCSICLCWCVGVCWCVLVCVGVCWCVLVCVGMCWCVLVCQVVLWEETAAAIAEESVENLADKEEAAAAGCGGKVNGVGAAPVVAAVEGVEVGP